MYGKDAADSMVEYSSVGISDHQQKCCKIKS